MKLTKVKHHFFLVRNFLSVDAHEILSRMNDIKMKIKSRFKVPFYPLL